MHHDKINFDNAHNFGSLFCNTGSGKSFKIIVSCVDSYFSKDMQLSWLGAGVYLQDPYDPNFDLQVESIDRLKLPQTFRKLTSILKLNYVVNVCTFYSK